MKSACTCQQLKLILGLEQLQLLLNNLKNSELQLNSHWRSSSFNTSLKFCRGKSNNCNTHAKTSSPHKWWLKLINGDCLIEYAIHVIIRVIFHLFWWFVVTTMYFRMAGICIKKVFLNVASLFCHLKLLWHLFWLFSSVLSTLFGRCFLGNLSGCMTNACVSIYT